MADPNLTPYLRLNLDSDADKNRNWSLIDQRLMDLAARLVANVIGPGMIQQSMLAKPSVGTPELFDGSVTQAKLAASVVMPIGGPAGGVLTGTYPNPGLAAGVVAQANLTAPVINQLLPSYAIPANTNMVPTVQANGTVAWQAAQGGIPSGAAGGDLKGTYPNPSLSRIVANTLEFVAQFKAFDTTTGPVLTANDGTLTSYNNALPGWAIGLDILLGRDDIAFYRHPAGSSTYAEMFTFLASGDVNIRHALQLGPLGGTPAAGMVQWTGTVWQGYDGTQWITFGQAGTGGPPSGPAGGSLSGNYPNPLIANLAISNAMVNDVAWAKVTGAPTTFPPSGAASGDLSGTYPNPTVARLNGLALGTMAALRGAILAVNSSGVIGQLQLGAAGTILTSNGSDAIWANPSTTPAALVPAPLGGDVGKAVTIASAGTFAYTTIPTTLPGPPTGAAGGALSGTYPNPGVVYSNITGIPTNLPPSGAASGDLGGTYPSPTVVQSTPAAGFPIYAGQGTPVFNHTTTTAMATLQLGLGTAKVRLQGSNTGSNVGTGGIFSNRNWETGAQDDATRPSWGIVLGASDTCSLQRNPAGSTTATPLLTAVASGQVQIPGPATGTDLAPALFGTRTAKGRLQALPSLDWVGLTLNQIWNGSAWTRDDPTGIGWRIAIRSDLDTASFEHVTAAGVGVSPLIVDGAGNLTIFGPNAQKSTGTVWINPSDSRLKKNVVDWPTGLQAILALRPVAFQYNGLGGTLDDGVTYQGLIADEVQPVLPECVQSRPAKLNPDDETTTDILMLDTSDITLALVNAIKELTSRVVTLEAKP